MAEAKTSGANTSQKEKALINYFVLIVFKCLVKTLIIS